MKCSLVFISVFACFICVGQLNELDSQGRKQGEWAKLYAGTNALQYTGQFIDDKPVGEFVYYYKSSKVKAIIKHELNSLRSLAYYYHENGAMMSYGIFRNQLKDSVWVNFGVSERLSSTETYLGGKLTGKKVVYYVSKDVGNMSQVPSGVYMYADNLLHGEVTKYFTDFTVMETGQYIASKKEGVWLAFRANGKRSTLTRYKGGVRHGWCLGFDSFGKENMRKYYAMGELIEGERLKKKMAYMKANGINPNN